MNYKDYVTFRLMNSSTNITILKIISFFYRREQMIKMDETLTMLKDLTDAKAIPGNEREVREVMKKYIEPYADEIMMDNLGSLIAKKKGTSEGPKIMVAGHLDEVGFMVTQITDKGFLRFQNNG
jgi:putative aminopeptidase FrvX